MRPAARPNKRRPRSAVDQAVSAPATALGMRASVSGGKLRPNARMQSAMSDFISIGCSTSSPPKSPTR